MTRNIKPAAITQRVKDAWNQFPAWWAAFFWLVTDIWKAFSGATIWLTVFAVLGASLQGAVLLGAVKYIGLLEQNGGILLGRTMLQARDSSVLILAVTSLFALLALSAGMIYGAGVIASRLTGRYQVLLLKRTITLFGALVSEHHRPQNSGEALQLITRTALQDSQKAAFMIRFLAGSISSGVILLYAFPILVVLDMPLTLLLLGLLLLFVPFFYYANIMAYRSDLMLRRSAVPAKRSLMQLMRDIRPFQNLSVRQQQEMQRAFSKGHLRGKTEALPLYFLSLAQTEFYTNLLLGVSIGLVIVIKIPQAMAGQIGWVTIMAYLLFLRLSINSFRVLMLCFNRFSRFYPYIERCQHVVNSVTGNAALPCQPLLMTAASNGIFESTPHITIRPPMRLMLISSLTLDRYTLPYLIRLSISSESGLPVSPDECFFLGNNYLIQHDGSVRDMIGASETCTMEYLKKKLSGETVRAIISLIGQDLDWQIAASNWNRFTCSQKIELSILAAEFSPARIVVMSQRVLNQIRTGPCKRSLAHLQTHKVLVIVCNISHARSDSFIRKENAGNLCVVLSSRGHILALGRSDWLIQHLDAIQTLLDRESQQQKTELSIEQQIGLEDEP